MKSLLAVVALAASALLVSSADAKTCVWTGVGANGKWTNPDNWQDGAIPGRITDNSVLSGEGGDIAEFGAVADGAKTTIDMTGVTSIGGIKVVGANAPAYTFGTSTADAQQLNLEADGFGFFVGEDVAQAPIIASRYRAVYVASTTPNVTICNESTQSVLVLPSATTSTSSPDYDGKITLTYFDFRGAGDIRIGKTEGYAYRDFGWTLNQTGKLIIGCSLAGGYGKYTPMMIVAGSVPSENGQAARIEVEEGVVVSGSTQWGPSFNVNDSDVEIFGAGTWGFNWRSGYDAGDARVRIAKGRKLAISCKYRASCDKGEPAGVRAYKGNGEDNIWYGGDWAFYAENEIAGPLQNFFGNMETDRAGGFGQGDIQLASDSILRSVAAADWTLTQPVYTKTWPSRTGASGAIEVAGAGVWTLAGGVTTQNSGTTSTITFLGDGEGVVDSVVSNGTGTCVLAIVKSGSGTWTLKQDNTFTGSTTVNAGTLKVAASSSLSSSSSVALKGGTLCFEGDGSASVVTQELERISVSVASSTLKLSGKVVVNLLDFAAETGFVLDVVTDDPEAKLIVPTDKETVKAVKFTWNGQPVVFGADGEVKLNADAVIAARGDVVPDNGGHVAIFFDGTSGNDTLAADTTTLTKLTQLSKTPATVGIGTGRTLLTPSVVLVASAADLTLGAVGDKGTLDSPTRTISFDNQGEDSKITLNAAPATGVTNELAHGVTVIAADMALGETKVALADKAKARLEIRDCTVDTGIETVYIGNNTGNNYNGGGMQCGELTVSNALVRNVADLARTSRTYAKGIEYGIFVGKNAGGILRVQDGAVISNKLQIGTGAGGIASGDGYASTGGRGSGAVYQSGGLVATVGGAEYRQNVLGNAGMGYYELKGGSFVGRMAIATYGYGIWHQEPGTTADLKGLSIAAGNGGHADVYVRGLVTATSDNSQIAGGHQNGNISVITVDGPGFLDMGGQTAYAFNSSAISTCFVNLIRGGKIKVGNIYRHGNAYGNAGLFDISFDGGVLVAGSNNDEMFASDGQGRPKTYVDHVRIYKGGMTVDTDGHNAGTKLPLLRPDGLGVASVSFDYAAFKKWHTPPFIQISGDGTGATARALYDSVNQTVTGVVITCSGRGYTAGTTTVTATYKGNGVPANVTGSCELAENDVAGSFTKTGAGTFTLGAANTWGGATVAAGGTLKADCDWAVPADLPVVLAGGKIDFNGKAGSVSKVTYKVGGGSIVNAENVTLPTTFDMEIAADEILAGQSIPLTGDQDLTGKTLTITGDFSSLDPAVCRKYTVVSVAGGTISGEPTIVAPALPEDWTFMTRPNGVKLVVPQGMTLIVR